MSEPSDNTEPNRVQSWTGSENERRPQGVCPPPRAQMDQTARYRVRAGVPVEIKSVAEIVWRPFRTTKDSQFERYEMYRDRHYVFREGGYQMRVHRRFVVHRADQT